MKMTQDEIIAIARQVGFESNENDIYKDLSLEAFVCVDYELVRFANLIAEIEREACAKVCDEFAERVASQWCAERIRERGD
jgi:hypothetical protein